MRLQKSSQEITGDHSIISDNMNKPEVAKTDESLEVYKFGVVPQFEARKIHKIWSPILSEIGRRMNKKFILVGSPRIPEFEVMFTRGEFDFAYMNPYHCLLAFDSQKYVPIVNDASRKLFGILAVRNDSLLRDIKDLQDKTIAFPAPNALGASLMTQSELKARKITYKKIFPQTHTSSSSQDIASISK